MTTNNCAQFTKKAPLTNHNQKCNTFYVLHSSLYTSTFTFN